MNELLEQAILDKKLLEAKVLSFYLKLKNASSHMGEKSHEGIEAGYWTAQFKEHFKIETHTKGIIDGNK